MATQLKILLVEDDDNDADLFRLAVRRSLLNCSIERVWDGETAVNYLTGKGDYANRERYPLPHVVITDTAMPRRTGLELLEWRRTSPFSKIPFVVWTGRPDLLSKCFELGADSGHVKGSSFEALLKCLEQVSGSGPGSNPPGDGASSPNPADAAADTQNVLKRV